jgi:hypothetical protein
MTLAIVDTPVVIHLYRHYLPARSWFGSLSQPLGITPITGMEVDIRREQQGKTICL